MGADGAEGAGADPGPLVGRLLDGRYRVLSPLGEGGMGAVYLTQDERLGRKVVVKVPHASQALTQGFRARFKKEIQSLTSLDHPHVVKVLDMGETPDGVPYAVMPYLSGGSLKDRLAALSGPPSVAQLGAWLAPIAEALDSIHRKGFIHRDVKPGNLLFDDEGNPYLADFGIVKVLHSGETSLTQSGFIPGSPEYMAPEAVTGLEAGPAYDQYSLGAVAYEALTGQVPITGQTAVEVLVKKRAEAARPIEASRPDLPVPLKDAVMRALERDPEKRFGSCAEMVTAAQLAQVDRARSVAVITLPKLPSGLPAARPLWRRPWVKVAAAVLAATGIGAGAWALLGGEPGGAVPALSWVEPVEGQIAFEGERVRLRLKTDGLAPGDVLRVDGEPRAGAGGWLNALVDMAGAPGRDVVVTVLRDGDEVARATRRVAVEPVPRPEVPEWARVSREQVLEARRIGVPVAFENPLGMRFVLVPGGTFDMGSPEWEPERLVRERLSQTTLTHASYAQITHVTNGQFRRWRPAHHTEGWADADRDADEHPAGSLAHADARAFAAWVAGQDPAHAYDLPTSAEWERLARAGMRATYWWGDDPLLMGKHENVCDRRTLAANPGWEGLGLIDDGFAASAPVGSFAPNAWGVFDPVGDTMTWCLDVRAWVAGVGLHPSPSPQVDPVGAVGEASGDVRVVRGTTWASMGPALSARVAARSGYGPDGSDPVAGRDRSSMWMGARLVARIDSPPHPGGVDEPVVLVVEEPLTTAVALEGQWIRVRARVEGWREGDEVRVGGEARGTLEGWLNCLVKAEQQGEQTIAIDVRRAGAQVAETLARANVEAVPRPEVPEWARVSQEQLLEARRIGVPVAFENPLGMRFVLVPSGTFEMGSPPWEPNRQPWEKQARVTLTQACYMQTVPATNAQVRRWRPDHRPEPWRDMPMDLDTQPATGLTHGAATAFADWVSTQDGERRYALPTEAEFERAARAGTRGRFPWGDDPRPMGRFANVCDARTLAHFRSWTGYAGTDDGHAGLAPAGVLEAHAWGLHDMLGNVKQWCADRVDTRAGHLPNHRAGAVDPAGKETGAFYLLRGNTWANDNPVAWCRSAARGYYTDDGLDPHVSPPVSCLPIMGVRLVVRLPAPPRRGEGSDPLTLVVQEPATGEAALAGQWIRVRARVEGWREGDEVRVDGEPRALLEGQLGALVEAGKPGTRQVVITVVRGGEEIARAERQVLVDVVPRPEVPAWARVSREQLLEARRFGVPVAFENPLGMRFVLVPSGATVIGSPPWEPGRNGSEQQTPLTLTRPCYVQATEVTLGQVRRWRPAHEAAAVMDQVADGDTHPATRLTHPEALEFAAWVSQQDPARRYELVGDAVWEHAARAGMRSMFWWGDEVDLAGRFENLCDRRAIEHFPGWQGEPRIDDGFVGYAPVGSLAPNAWGLYDLLGNVSEWCADAYRGRAGPMPYPAALADPVPMMRGETRARRGAHWSSYPVRLGTRLAARGYYLPDGRDPSKGDTGDLLNVGLRLMVPVTVDPPAAAAPERPPEPAPAPVAAAPRLTVESPEEGQVALDGEWVHVRARVEGLAEGDAVEVDGAAQTLSGPYVHTGLRMKGVAPCTVEVRVTRGAETLLSERRTISVEPVPRPEVPEWARVGKRQLDEARRIGKPVAFEDEFGLRFVLIPAGEFDMGSPEWEPGHARVETLHAVRISKPYYLGATEVPNSVAKRARPARLSGASWGLSLEDPAQPAVRVTFPEAGSLARWLSSNSAGFEYRLPTEAEWEHAVRAGAQGRFPWGEDEGAFGRFANVADLDAKAKIPDWSVLPVRDGHAVTAPVGSLEPNAWGVWDGIGNALEWVSDWWSEAPEDLSGTDPAGPDAGTWRVLRGSAFGIDRASECRLATRAFFREDAVNPESSDDMSTSTGLRLVAVPK